MPAAFFTHNRFMLVVRNGLRQCLGRAIPSARIVILRFSLNFLFVRIRFEQSLRIRPHKTAPTQPARPVRPPRRPPGHRSRAGCRRTGSAGRSARRTSRSRPTPTMPRMDQFSGAPACCIDLTMIQARKPAAASGSTPEPAPGPPGRAMDAAAGSRRWWRAR